MRMARFGVAMLWVTALINSFSAATPRLMIKETVLSRSPTHWVRREDWLVPSQDERHVAFRERVGDRWRVVCDGVEGKEYRDIDFMSFSPADQKVVYVAADERGKFLVVGAFEGNAYEKFDEDFTSEQFPFVHSNDGRRVAFAAIDRAGQRVVVDGTEGRVYGAILRRSFSFSEDSLHFAYAAKRDGHDYVIKDGVEVAEAEALYVNNPGLRVAEKSFGPYLSPDGSRLAYAIIRGTNVVVVLDGKASQPWPQLGMFESVLPGRIGFSPDGKHFTYLAGRDERFVVVLDDKILAECEAASHVVFSPNGKHHAFVYGRQSEPGGSIQSALVFDGRKDRPCDGEIQRIWFSPDGKKLAYDIFNQRAEESQPRSVAVYGGKRFEGIDIASDVVFSPDSRHWAFLGMKNRKGVIVSDGEIRPARTSMTIDHFIGFSPIGKTLAYVTSEDFNHFVTIADKEYGPYHEIGPVDLREPLVYFSEDAKHFAFQVGCGPHQRGSLVFDGVQQEVPGEWLTTSMLEFDSPTKLHGLVMDDEKIRRIDAEIVR